MNGIEKVKRKRVTFFLFEKNKKMMDYYVIRGLVRSRSDLLEKLLERLFRNERINFLEYCELIDRENSCKNNKKIKMSFVVKEEIINEINNYVDKNFFLNKSDVVNFVLYNILFIRISQDFLMNILYEAKKNKNGNKK